MEIYQSKYKREVNSSHAQVMKVARYEYHKIQKRTPRRQPYIRSVYFRKDKVFINQFWEHLKQKRFGDQMRRTRFFLCAIDLMRNTKYAPETIFKADDRDIMLHRFYGRSHDGFEFCVQVRESKRTGRKDFMSVFPVPNKNQ